MAAGLRQCAIHLRHFAALGFLLVFQAVEKDEKRAEREKVWAAEGIRGSELGGSGGFRNPSGAGVVFSVRFWRRNRRAGGREREKSVLYRGCTGLLYEILIPGDIQQAYIRLACKSPPYLISRGCDAPGDDGSFYAATTFPSLCCLLFPVVKFDQRWYRGFFKKDALSAACLVKTLAQLRGATTFYPSHDSDICSYDLKRINLGIVVAIFFNVLLCHSCLIFLACNSLEYTFNLLSSDAAA